jgi:protein O-mannosyl-transferase
MVYFFWFFIPYPLSAFHPFPPPGHLGSVIYLSPWFLAGFIFAIWYFRTNRLVVFGLLFFLVNLLLVLQLIPIGFTIVSERYTYVPYIGLAFLFTTLAIEHLKKQALVPAIAGFVIIFSLFGFLTFKRTEVWKDSDSLWSDVIARYPDASLPRADRAQFNYSKAVMMDATQAIPLFQRVIEDCSVVIKNDEEEFKSRGKKSGSSMYQMRSVAYSNLRQYQKALDDLNVCLQINPNDSEALYERGTLFVNNYRRYAEALADFDRAIQISPQGKYYLNRSICHYKMGDIVNAEADLQAASQKGVSVPESYRNLVKAAR